MYDIPNKNITIFIITISGWTPDAVMSRGIVDRLVQAGRYSDALHEMKVIRCDLMDELHQSQRRVDCLDYLIRQTEKEIKTTTERR